MDWEELNSIRQRRRGTFLRLIQTFITFFFKFLSYNKWNLDGRVHVMRVIYSYYENDVPNCTPDCLSNEPDGENTK